MRKPGLIAGNNTMARQYQYQSFLLRLWQEKPGEAWRASAKEILSGERVHFANLDDLFTYLQTQTQLNDGEKRPPLDQLTD